jgi:hypothetical protein
LATARRRWQHGGSSAAAAWWQRESGGGGVSCTFEKKQSYFLDYTYSDVKLLCTSWPVCCDGSPESSFLLGP